MAEKKKPSSLEQFRAAIDRLTSSSNPGSVRRPAMVPRYRYRAPRINDRDIDYFMVCRLIDAGQLEEARVTLNLLERVDKESVTLRVLQYFMQLNDKMRDSKDTSFVHTASLPKPLAVAQWRSQDERLQALYLSTVKIVGPSGKHSPTGYVLRALIACYLEQNFERASALHMEALKISKVGSPPFIVSLFEQAFILLAPENITTDQVKKACEYFLWASEYCPNAYYFLAACQNRLVATEDFARSSYVYLLKGKEKGSRSCEECVENIVVQNNIIRMPLLKMPYIPTLLCYGFKFPLLPRVGFDMNVEVSISDEARLERMKKSLEEFMSEVKERMEAEEAEPARQRIRTDVSREKAVAKKLTPP